VTVHALCWPLLTAADGSKLGKTTGARVWLDPARTSPYELYQHFIQTDDRQVRQLLAWLTLLPVDEIDRVVSDHEASPERRLAQRALAREVTAIVHGRAAAEQAEQGTQAFQDGLDPRVLRDLEASMPTTTLSGTELPFRVVDLLVRTGLQPSKGAATRLIRQGGAYCNDQVVDSPEAVIEPDDLIEGRWLLVRAGKRHRHLVVVAG
jgi:tyrosyl-tRNA synthetase